MRSDGSRSTTGISAAARKTLRPDVESSSEALAALALLARTRADTAPVTGRAFLALARGDTAAAAAGFEKAATELGDAAPLLLATAARLYAAHHSEQQAVTLWSAIVQKSSDAPGGARSRARVGARAAPRRPERRLRSNTSSTSFSPTRRARSCRRRAASWSCRETGSCRRADGRAVKCADVNFPHAFLESCSP